MKVFDFSDYKVFVKSTINLLPNKGRGEITRMANETGIHQTLLSQVFSGPKDLTETQTYLVAQYLGLDADETSYFALLAKKERLDNPHFKSFVEKEMNSILSRVNRVARASRANEEISLEVQAELYSQWVHIGVLTSLSGNSKLSRSEIAKTIQVSEKQVQQSLKFLEAHHFVEEFQGKYTALKRSTYLPSDSPIISIHHNNWRLKAMEKIGNRVPSDFFVSAPFSANQDDLAKLKKILLQAFEKFSDEVTESRGQDVFCLNLDLFQL